MSARPGTLKTEQLDMDSLFDFSGTTSTTQPSPATASSSKIDATPKATPQDWSAVSPYDSEQRQFNGPSHDYNQYRQQVGLPMGSIANIPAHSMYDGFGSGIGDMGFDSGFGGGWSSGIDMDSEMTVDFNNPASAMPAMFFPPQDTNTNNADNFIDPSSIAGQDEPTSNVGRLWPGMHSQQAQQAAMQKASQVQASQQRQMKMQAQQAQYRVASTNSNTPAPAQSSNGHSKRPSHVSDPHVEESISRLLNQMRHNSTVSNDDDDDSQSNMPHLARLKKDEDDMDEDERLLASEEGKKLSSKERRQLRNKVSARAFRSRRKEYIGQLEGEVALKTQEANNLRSQNAALMQENDSYRGLIETLLRHPSFTPFINDLSQDPSALLALQQRPQQAPQQQPQQAPQQQQQHQRRPSATPAQQPAQPAQPQQQQQSQQEAKPDYLNFDASQLQLPSQQQTERVNLAMIPENDFSKLNLNGFATMNFNNYRVNAFAVTTLPQGPDPVDLFAADCEPATYLNALNSGVCDEKVSGLLARLEGAATRVKA